MHKKRNHKRHILIILLTFILIGVAGVFITINREQIIDEWDWLTIKSEQKMDVPIENQLPEYPNGCEVTALSMLLNYYHVDVTKRTLARNIKHVPSFEGGKYMGNPHKGFVGYMTIANAGWCVYNEPLYDVAHKYTNRIRNYTGHSFIQVMKLVSDGHPIMIISTLKFKRVNDMQTWDTHQGKVKVTPSSHACVITGYNKKKLIVYVNNPYGKKNQAVSWKDLEASFNQQGKQALYMK
ncbi:C39 family peptidase [Lactobacillus sp. PV034]|uniref:C39 family peptidase n=1 Tax=Lactobacillus sp. PV034 TaxID=2594495 RepID=UPI00223FF4AC|nr:C39 family peptidase [Lactobacillus sp. PV034]QNQ80447.1 hypothetical protein FP432_02210 [Lactobacillus sp. PV034]